MLAKRFALVMALAAQLFFLPGCGQPDPTTTITVRSVTWDCTLFGGGSCGDGYHVVTATDGRSFAAEQNGWWALLAVGKTYRIWYIQDPNGCDQHDQRPCISGATEVKPSP